MKVSIGIPVYNGMPFIVETINSILSGQYQDFEIVISDDRSNDGTSEWLARLNDERIKIINPSNRLNMAENWSFVFQHCTGDFVKIISADDLITAKGLKNQVEILRKHEDVCAVFSSRRIIDINGDTVISNLGFGIPEGVYRFPKAMKISLKSGRNQFGETCSALFRRADLGDFDPAVSKFEYLLDMHLYMQLVERRNIFISNEVASCFRIQQKSLSVRTVKTHSRQFSEFVDYVVNEYKDGEYQFRQTEIAAAKTKGFIVMQLRRIVYYFLKVRLVFKNMVNQ